MLRRVFIQNVRPSLFRRTYKMVPLFSSKSFASIRSFHKTNFQKQEERETGEEGPTEKTNPLLLLLGGALAAIALYYGYKKYFKKPPTSIKPAILESKVIGNTEIQVAVGDWRHEFVDAVVNIVSETRRHGGSEGGVVAEKTIKGGTTTVGFNEAEIKPHGGKLKPGDYAVVDGEDVDAKKIISIVVPKFIDGKSGEEQALMECAYKVLKIADEHGFQSITLPPLGIGSDFSIEGACRLDMEGIAKYLKEHPDTNIKLIRFMAPPQDVELQKKMVKTINDKYF